MTWIVLANTNQCRIYAYLPNQLTLLHTIDHPENKLKSSELGTDRPGHYQTNTTARGAYSPHHELNDIKRDDFAREIAKTLADAHNKNQFQALIFIMGAQMEGLVLPHLDKHVAELIQQVIQKNIMHLSEHELLAYLNNRDDSDARNR